jgi:hypothetical protein
LRSRCTTPIECTCTTTSSIVRKYPWGSNQPESRARANTHARTHITRTNTH